MSVGARELLALEPVGESRFRALHNLDNGLGAIFGGQPMLQALAAAAQTVPGWAAHSYSAQFLRAGQVALPVDYDVETTRDGRRYATRRVVARQDGQIIFDMLCSFHDPEEGPHHAMDLRPSSPPPETLQDAFAFMRDNADRLPGYLAKMYERSFPIALRLIEPEAVMFRAAEQPDRAYWFSMPSAEGITAPRDHQALLAMMSDFWFAGTAGARHVATEGPSRLSVVTLNHSLWFHAPVRTDRWLLYCTDTPWAGEGRGLVRGLIYDEAGVLVASTAQEVSMRAR